MKTATEYKAYQNRVAEFLQQNGVKAGCNSPVDPESLGFFSWRPCECCGSRLGGNRETYSFAFERKDANRRGEFVASFEADICDDCVYYLAYGELDDATMLEISEL